MDRREERWSAYAVLSCLVGFIVLTVLVAIGGPVDALDRSVRDTLFAHRSPTRHDLATGVTRVLGPLADALTLTAAAGIVAWRRRRVWPIVVAFLTGWAMTIVVLGVKHALDRPGPDPVPGAAEHLSYPSGHTAAVVVCYGLVAVLVQRHRRRPVWPAMLVVAALTALVAVALIYAGYHWLFDTVGSVLLGSALVAGADRWVRRRVSPRSRADTPPTDRTARRH